MSPDVLARACLGAGLAGIAVLWFAAMLGRLRDAAVPDARGQARLDRFMVLGVGLLLVAAGLDLVDGGHDTGRYVLAAAALSGWAQERRRRPHA